MIAGALSQYNQNPISLGEQHPKWKIIIAEVCPWGKTSEPHIRLPSPGSGIRRRSPRALDCDGLQGLFGNSRLVKTETPLPLRVYIRFHMLWDPGKTTRVGARPICGSWRDS